jgi:hypothetical protein
VIEVIAFTGTLPHSGKNGDTTVLHGDVMNHLHHDNGFANTGAAEHAHLTAAGKRHQQIDDLYAGFKHVDFHILFGEFRCQTVNRHHFLLADGAKAIHRPTHNIENASQAGLANGHHDGAARIFTGMPRTRPSVTSMAMVRTTLSPRCWATSTTRLSSSSLMAGLEMVSA